MLNIKIIENLKTVSHHQIYVKINESNDMHFYANFNNRIRTFLNDESSVLRQQCYSDKISQEKEEKPPKTGCSI